MGRGGEVGGMERKRRRSGGRIKKGEEEWKRGTEKKKWG